MSMSLQTLLNDMTTRQTDVPVVGLCMNSQMLEKGELFIALAESPEIQKHMQMAVEKGACAILCEGERYAEHTFCGVPVITVPLLRSHLPKLTQKMYGQPDANMHLVGVTGTNGKTSTTFLLAQALTKLGKPCGIIGTNGAGLPKSLVVSQLTTPDMLWVQKQLYLMQQKGAVACAMEISSHALAQKRVQGLKIDSAHFTNLTQDHLDYHVSMADYARAKQKLFLFPTLKRACVNVDSPYAEKMLSAVNRGVEVAMVTLKPTLNVTSRYHHWMGVANFECTPKGIVADIIGSFGQAQLRSGLLGEFNLSNLLGVLVELCLLGFSLKEATRALASCQGAPGRMEKLGHAYTPTIIIDYAHTPDALELALKAAGSHTKRKLWCVFGCGGNRDTDKRAKMGAIAYAHADRIVLTNDNPRQESEMDIIQSILSGMPAQGEENKVHIELSRQKAIAYAMQHALPIDTILIAGKGHEDYQIIGTEKNAFSDKACVQALLGEEHEAK